MKKWLRSPLGTGLTFALAAVLIAVGGINVAFAAPSIVSKIFKGNAEMASISTELIEKNAGKQNGAEVACAQTDKEGDFTELLTGIVGKDETLRIGDYYTDELTVKNNGVIPEYVRVTLNRFWTYEGEDAEFRAENGYVKRSESTPAADGENETEKTLILNPNYIALDANEADWDIEYSENGEMVTFYYKKLLQPGETTTPLINGISILNGAKKEVLQGTYWYDGVHLHLKARVDAVQDHNRDQAIKGAWGVER